MIFIASLLLMGCTCYNQESEEACIDKTFDLVRKECRDHACAVMRAGQTVSSISPGWYLYEPECTYYGYEVIAFCIPMSYQSAWIKQTQEDGPKYWRYQSNHFIQEDDRITFKTNPME
ncbi:hypothetical protein DSO57_1005933 [Entomophthora muscae]|uniref:Uncharacterized protein n=1 Tax=Entomophthora muscae TaxID=34485 RepID=A0ACC2RYQ1_9FUNG|nr:hypothetical protein DSO57_1005933 [Entomophthora muscae]